jgi:kynurenine formamidase
MLKFSDHSGTHIDAPLHFIRGGQSTDEMELGRMIGDGLLLDVSDFKKPDEAVTREMLERAEQQQKVFVKENDIVLVRTRKGQWGEEGFFQEHSFDRSAGDWLVEKRVNMIGLDLPNIDVNDNMKREVHMKVLGSGIYIVENLINLESLPKDQYFQFIALPLKLENATASPIRAIAMLKNQERG